MELQKIFAYEAVKSNKIKTNSGEAFKKILRTYEDPASVDKLKAAQFVIDETQ